MKKKLLVIIILLCLILPFKVLAFEFSKGNATSGYEKLSLSKCQITSTSDGGYIIYGKIIDDYGAELKSQVIKFNSNGKMVKSNDQLDKDLKFVVEFKGTLFAIINEYVQPFGNLSTPKGKVKIYKLTDELNLGDLVYSNDEDYWYDEVHVMKDYIVAYAFEGKFSEQSTQSIIPVISRFDYNEDEFHKTDITPDQYDHTTFLLLLTVFSETNQNNNKYAISDLNNLYAYDVSNPSDYIFKYTVEDFDEMYYSTVLNNGNYVVYVLNGGLDENGNDIDKDQSLRLLDKNGNPIKTIPVNNKIADNLYPTKDGGLIYYKCTNDVDNSSADYSNTCIIEKYDENLNLINSIDIGTYEVVNYGASGVTQLKNGDIVLSFVTNSSLEKFNITSSGNNQLVNLIFKDDKNEKEDEIVKVPNTARNKELYLVYLGIFFVAIGSIAIKKCLSKSSI